MGIHATDHGNVPEFGNSVSKPAPGPELVMNGKGKAGTRAGTGTSSSWVTGMAFWGRNGYLMMTVVFSAPTNEIFFALTMACLR